MNPSWKPAQPAGPRHTPIWSLELGRCCACWAVWPNGSPGNGSKTMMRRFQRQHRKADEIPVPRILVLGASRRTAGRVSPAPPARKTRENRPCPSGLSACTRFCFRVWPNLQGHHPVRLLVRLLQVHPLPRLPVPPRRQRYLWACMCSRWPCWVPSPPCWFTPRDAPSLESPRIATWGLAGCTSTPRPLIWNANTTIHQWIVTEGRMNEHD